MTREARLIAARQMRELLGGCSDMFIWRRLRDDPTFPRPIYFARRRFWREAEITAWIEDQADKAAA